MLRYLFTIIYFVDACHCPALEEDGWHPFVGDILTCVLMFLKNSATSSISLTVNVLSNTFQPPEFGWYFLLRCILHSNVSIASFFRIMNFSGFLCKNYPMKQGHKNEPKVVSLLLLRLKEKLFQSKALENKKLLWEINCTILQVWILFCAVRYTAWKKVYCLKEKKVTELEWINSKQTFSRESSDCCWREFWRWSMCY